MPLDFPKPGLYNDYIKRVYEIRRAREEVIAIAGSQPLKTVLIAEDELLVRLGLQAMVQWEKEEMRIVACVSNGQAALEAWRRFKPDIVITDIVMPGLGGLDLMRAIRQEGGACAFVVITAHGQGETMRHARELSVSACLIKATMTQQDVSSALMLARSHLASSGLSAQSRGPRDAQDARRAQAERMLAACLPGGAEAWNAAVAPPPAAYLMVRIPQTARPSPILLRTMRYSVEEVFSGSGVMAAVARDHLIVLAFDQPLARRREELLDALQALRQYTRLNLLLSPDMLIVSPARHTPPHACLTRMHGVMGAPQFSQQGVAWVDGDFAQPVNLTKRDFAAWYETVLDALWLLQAPSRVYAAHALLVQSRAALQMGATVFFAECGKLLSLLSRAGWTPCAGEAEATPMESVRLRIEARRREQGRDQQERLGLVVRFLLENPEKDCSMEEAAQLAGFHPAYFSTLFKQQMRMGYAQFSTALGMEMAKRLLRESNLSVGQIAFRCGYEDVAYFSRAFKRTVGVTPSVWRQKGI